MQHTGMLFLSNTPPLLGAEPDGTFRIELVLMDNLGKNPHTGRDQRERYEVRWSGPEAQAWWREHGQQMQPGTPLLVELHRLQAHIYRHSYPPLPTLRGRVVSLQKLPRRTTAPQTNTEASAA